jgi:ATP-dependent RNA helicase RhlE
LTTFLDLGLSEPIARALADEHYASPTPIQTQTIPQVLAARDVVGIAQTGTGKTAAFALPILDHLAKAKVRAEKRTCRVLVLSPTRELSAQIVESFRTYGRYLRPSVALAIGGVNINPQMRALAGGVDVLVATPGRLLDLLDHRAVSLDRVEVFVLDEADRMLDMGFIRDIRRIVTKLPGKRQTLFFSATMPPEITDLANHMLRDPVHVAVTPTATTVESVVQRVIMVDRAAKPNLLADLLRREPIERVLVFTRTKHGADKVVRALAKDGLAASAIHGNKSQGQRERVLAEFRAGKVRTLVATDIAARGIDVDGISHVVNYDLPNIPESYVHRIGRTARAGAAGVAISFCDAEERPFLRDIEKLIRMSIPATDQRGNPHTAVRPDGASAEETRRGLQQANRRPHRDARPHQKREAQPHAQRAAPPRASAHQDQQRAANGHQERGPRPQHERGARDNQQRNLQQRSSQQRQEHGERPRESHEGNMATVRFMREKPPARPHSPDHRRRLPV